MPKMSLDPEATSLILTTSTPPPWLWLSPVQGAANHTHTELLQPSVPPPQVPIWPVCYPSHYP